MATTATSLSSTTPPKDDWETKKKDQDLENRNIDYKKALEQLRGRKACFTATNSKIFVNLHIAAAQKAAQVLGLKQDDPNLGQFIINTGMSRDGRYIDGGLEINDFKDVGKATDKWFGQSNGKYEVGIVLQFTEYKAPLNKDIDKKDSSGKPEHDNKYSLKQILDYNYSKGTLKKYKDMIFEAMQEYMKWFCGNEQISPDGLQEFIPHYDGQRVQVQGGEIKSMDENEMVDYLMHRKVDASKEDEKSGEFFKPRLGFKMGYKIVY